MLDVGFGEMMIIGVLAIIVVGPERLPEMMRFLGRQYGKLMKTSNELRRAFFLEADRAEAEARAAEMKQRREEAKKRAEEARARVLAERAAATAATEGAAAGEASAEASAGASAGASAAVEKADGPSPTLMLPTQPPAAEESA